MHNSFSTYKFTTNSPTILVATNPTIYAIAPDRANLRLSIDGVLSYVQFTNTSPVEINIGVGTKTIELTEFPISDDGSGGHVGIFITSVQIQNGYTYTIINEDNPTDKYCFLGDSIPNGAAADPMTAGYGMLLRDSGVSVSFLTHGGASIYGDFAGDSTMIANTVNSINSLMDGSGTNKLFIHVGVNDYTGNVALSTFQTKYSDLLTAINAARTTIQIYCISPVVRSSEAANANGNTLGNFRTAVANACSGKSYCTYIDGSTLMTSEGLSGDGVHPTTAGHLTIYNSLLAALYTPVNSELATYVAPLVAKLSTPKMSKIDTFITSLKTGLGITNLSDAFDGLYLFSGETQESSLRNLVKNDFHCSIIGSLTFAQNLGITGNSAVGNGIAVDYFPSVDKVRYTQNNASFGVRLNNNIADYGCVFSTNTYDAHIGMCQLYPNYDGTLNARINGLPECTTANTNSIGLYSLVRTDANNVIIYKDNAATPITSASNGISTTNFAFMCMRSGGTKNIYDTGSTNQISFGYFGRAFTVAEIAVINTAFNNYFA